MVTGMLTRVGRIGQLGLLGGILMICAPIPEIAAERLEALRRYQILKSALPSDEW